MRPTKARYDVAYKAAMKRKPMRISVSYSTSRIAQKRSALISFKGHPSLRHCPKGQCRMHTITRHCPLLRWYSRGSQAP